VTLSTSQRPRTQKHLGQTQLENRDNRCSQYHQTILQQQGLETMETQKLSSAGVGSPLLPLSPERMNGSRLHSSTVLAHSPSLPEFGKASFPGDPFVSLTGMSPLNKSPTRSPLRGGHTRNTSSISNAHPTDATVQTMIARFDNMSIKDYKLSHDAALKRMEMAREMAEVETSKLKDQVQSKDADIKKSREEARKMKKELEDTKDRERKLIKRLDMLMVSFACLKALLTSTG
jgi:hypothetical protein